MARILAIDDDAGILTLIKNALRKDGHEVTCLSEVTEDLVNRLSFYDLILLDVMMPGIDGFTFCQKIRAYVDCPILFLTAKSLEEDVDYGFSLGADDYIKKPFSIVELRARIHAHLRREQREKSQCFSVCDVRFFLAKRKSGSLTFPSPLPRVNMKSVYFSPKIMDRYFPRNKSMKKYLATRAKAMYLPSRSISKTFEKNWPPQM